MERTFLLSNFIIFEGRERNLFIFFGQFRSMVIWKCYLNLKVNKMLVSRSPKSIFWKASYKNFILLFRLSFSFFIRVLLFSLLDRAINTEPSWYKRYLRFLLDIKRWYFSCKPDSDRYTSLMCNDPPIFSAFILKAAVSRLQELQVIAHCVRSKDRIISLRSARTQIAAHSRVQHYYTMWQKSLHRKMIEGVDAWSRQRTHVVR